MFLRIMLLFFIVFAFFGCNNKPAGTNGATAESDEPVSRFHQAAEFEPTSAIWLLWPNYDHKVGLSNAQVTLDIIKNLTSYARIKLVVPDEATKQKVLTLLPEGIIQRGQMAIYVIPYREFWARDMGPSFLIDKDGNLAMADFDFNGWGYSTSLDPALANDEKLDENIGAQMGLPVISSKLISEGGDHEVNGRGVMIACEAVEKNRNPKMSLKEIEAEFKRVLGVKKVIWLKQGLREDDHTFSGPLKDEKGENLYTVLTTNGHVDEMVRFVDTNVVVMAEVDTTIDKDPISRENARRLAVNYEILSKATDQNGQPLGIVRIPMPKAVITTMKPNDPVYDIISKFQYKDGSVFPKGKPVKVIAAASYLNFLMANDCILFPTYYRPGMDPAINQLDERAIAALQRVTLKKRIIPINALSVNFGGGGIHCITRNEPLMQSQWK